MKQKVSRPIEPTLPIRQAVIYARVSSKEQEKEGFSVPAQLKLLKEYAAAQGFAIAQEYVDVETAKQTGRTAFGDMVAYLKAHASVRVMLVEKTDRLYRNLKDWVTVDELEVEIHFPKEGVVLSRESRSSEKFMHGIKVLMAKNYIDNLSEEARKGMQEKAEQGIWPTKTPLGYRNITGADGKKVIEPDPAMAPLIARLFESYATGTLSVKDAARQARASGFVYPRSGAPIPVSTVHTILRNRLYSGDFDWNGRRFAGRHEPIVSRELWVEVQDVLDGRHARKHRRSKHDFAFSGLITCGHCGCALVGEIKKQRYVYYHCTGFRGKCKEPYVRQEVVERQFATVLGRLAFDDEVLAWVREALRKVTQMRSRSMMRRLLGFKPSTTGFRPGWIQCTSTSSMAGSTRRSLIGWPRNGAMTRLGACAISNSTKVRTNPTWTKASICWNWRGLPNGCSSGRKRAKNAACSTFWFRTAPGRRAS